MFEVDPRTLTVREVMSHDGSLLGAVSSALQVGDDLLLGSIFDDRIGIVEVRRGMRARGTRERRAPTITSRAA